MVINDNNYSTTTVHLPIYGTPAPRSKPNIDQQYRRSVGSLLLGVDVLCIACTWMFWQILAHKILDFAQIGSWIRWNAC